MTGDLTQHHPAAVATPTKTVSHMVTRSQTLSTRSEAPAPAADANAPVTRQYPAMPGSLPIDRSGC